MNNNVARRGGAKGYVTVYADVWLATLRAVVQKRKRQLLAVFTGSSQEALSAMMAASGGPMYQFAQLVNFPSLGDEYLEMLADHFARVHPGKHLDVAALRRAFDHIGHKPALMKDLVKAMSAEGVTEVEVALTMLVQDDRQVAGWRALRSRIDCFPTTSPPRLGVPRRSATRGPPGGYGHVDHRYCAS